MGFFGGKKTASVQAAAGTEVELEGVGKIKITRLVDCVGDSCPRPQLKTKKTLGEMTDGEIMEIGIDNQSSMEILPTMMGGFGAKHLGTVRDGNVWKLYIKKGA
jgi:tRNA 2-thiouridine synthesizing protein A